MTRYITVAEALFESLVNNRPFVDGNKRVAFAVVDPASIHAKMMELFATQSFDMAHLTPWLSQIVELR